MPQSTPVHVVVTTSTFPVDADDPVPRFVRDQVAHMAALDPDLRFHVLIPHHSYAGPVDDVIDRDTHREVRYHYFWPRAWEKLAGRGILPALRSNPLRYLLIPFFMAAQRRALLKLCRETEARMVYAHWYMPQGVVAQSVSRKLDIGLMMTTHASDVSVLNRVPFTQKLIANGLNRAQHVTAVSQRTANRLIQTFDAEEWQARYADKLSIIPMGTDRTAATNALDAALLSALGIQSDRYILSLGRLSEKKGLTYLIDAYAKLPESLRESVPLVIAGDGELAAPLQSQAVELGLQDVVIFTGFVQGAQKDTLLHGASVFALPSIVDDAGDSEGLPVALMEALAAGKSVVATNVSGAEEVLTEDFGRLVPEKSAGALAQALTDVLTQSEDTQAAWQQRARELATRFDWPDVARRHLALIRSTLESPV